MSRYQNGKIYKLVNTVDNKIYVGATCQSLTRRKSSHKGNKKQYPNRYVYYHLDQFDWDEEVDIILIENFPCNSKEELEARERYWFDQLQPELNKQKPRLTSEEREEYFKKYYENNKDKSKEYYENNKEYFKEYQGEYYENNKEYFKEYYENNKDKIKDYSKEYYKNNKNKDRINCECGGKTTKHNEHNHVKTKKHQQWLKNNSQQEDCSAVANLRVIEYPDEEI